MYWTNDFVRYWSYKVDNMFQKTTDTPVRDVRIDLLRVVFACGIVFHHVDGFIIGGHDFGYLGVEFFFFVSGFMFISMVDLNNKRNHALIALKRLMPTVLASVIIFVVFELIYFDHTIEDSLFISIWSIFDVLGMSMIGIPTPNLNGVLWFVSVYLVGLFILQIIAYEKGKQFLIDISPIGFLFVGLIYMSCGSIAGIWTTDYSKYWLILRGIADMFVGIFVFRVCTALRNRQDYFVQTQSKRWVGAIAFALTILVLLIMFSSLIELSNPRKEWLLYSLIVIIMIMISSSEVQSFLLKKITPYSKKIAIISLLLFLSHSYWTRKINVIFPDYDIEQLVILAVLLTIVTSVIILLISKAIVKSFSCVR